ncbi:MAG TPA: AAA family ATPase [Thermoplasmata archaeon]|nr:AAA family ATPase [Thermoplasmata archaeon]
MIRRHTHAANSGWIALTGTPGTGKSSVARALGRRWPSLEVSDLARSVGAARGSGRAVTVDLERLRAQMPTRPARPTVLVGHLAHLLPVGRVLLLRCHPLELSRRLSRRRSLSPRARRENLVSEAIDLIRWEVAAEGKSALEVDTTGRAPASVARECSRLLGGTAPCAPPRVDWLADPRVTEELLRGFR